MLIREPSGSLKVPYVGFQRNRDSMCHTIPHTVITIVQGKAVSVNSRFYHLNRPELKQWSCGFVGIDRHSADARRPGWIDLTMKPTTNSRQVSPRISYIFIQPLGYQKITCIPLKNTQNKRANLRLHAAPRLP